MLALNVRYHLPIYTMVRVLLSHRYSATDMRQAPGIGGRLIQASVVKPAASAAATI